MRGGDTAALTDGYQFEIEGNLEKRIGLMLL